MIHDSIRRSSNINALVQVLNSWSANVPSSTKLRYISRNYDCTLCDGMTSQIVVDSVWDRLAPTPCQISIARESRWAQAIYEHTDVNLRLCLLYIIQSLQSNCHWFGSPPPNHRERQSRWAHPNCQPLHHPITTTATTNTNHTTMTTTTTKALKAFHHCHQQLGAALFKGHGCHDWILCSGSEARIASAILLIIGPFCPNLFCLVEFIEYSRALLKCLCVEIWLL